MKTIWKFPIYVIDSQLVNMPKGAEILTVQLQGNQPCIWAMVDDCANSETRTIEVHGTGNMLRQDISRKYIGTFQAEPFVWHVFERV